ncbi:hypothetical protein [Maioricimonas sp. JC845]
MLALKGKHATRLGLASPERQLGGIRRGGDVITRELTLPARLCIAW